MELASDGAVLWLGAGVLLGLVAAFAFGVHLRLRRLARDLAAQTDVLRRTIGDARTPAPRPAVAVPRPQFMYMGPGGVPSGPVDLTQLQAMLLDGRLAEEALVAVVGTDCWRTLADGVAGAMVDPLADTPGMARAAADPSARPRLCLPGRPDTRDESDLSRVRSGSSE